jgi:hypothetical protein
MKSSKIAKCIAIIVLLFSNLSLSTKPTGDSFVEVYFSGKQDIIDLVGIQADLAKQAIKLNYDFLRFNKEGNYRRSNIL